MNPLSLELQLARMELLKAVNEIMQAYSLPPCLLDGVVTGILSDIRMQSSSELVRDIQIAQSQSEEQKDGETSND
jgi:hypothetical protein